MSAPLVGILGAGQLGRMLALAGYPLGLRFRFLDSVEEAPAGQLAEFLRGDSGDPIVLDHFRQGLAVVGYEFENVPVDLARTLAAHVPVYPPPEALEASQDRLTEKTLFNALGLATAPFRAIGTQADLEQAARDLGYPSILKTRRLGYDGKGQHRLNGPGDLAPAWAALGSVPLILEGFVPFQRELSILAVRGRAGEVAAYPLVENLHRDGILQRSVAPAPNLGGLQAHAEDLARRVLERLDYVGVLAIEFFDCDGRLVANEMAPRVHNSGHWTIEGAECSQFENHLRAILGWPLGSVAVPRPCAMVNLIGTVPATEALLALPGVHLHLYGKTPRAGRKLGHVTIIGPDRESCAHRLAAVCELLEGGQ
jgi:5-(carboxyamino)imidazole ribonucleotide synthase